MFFEYCEFVFGVIDIFLARRDFSKRTPWLRRLFISERLTGIFITHLQSKGYKVLDVPVGFIKNTELRFPVERRYGDIDAINIAFRIDENNFSQLGVSLTSLLDRIKQDRYYDIIILFSNLKKEEIDDFLVRANFLCKVNVSVRFYDVAPWEEMLDTKIKERLREDFSIFLLQKIFSDYKKILYLGANLIVLDDLAKIYDLPEEDSGFIAATLDIRRIFLSQQKLNRLTSVEGYENSDDFCSCFQTDVMIFYFEKMRNKSFDFYDVCIEESRRVEESASFSQNVLNLALKGHVKYFPVGWNLDSGLMSEFPSCKRILSESLLDEYLEGLKNPKIINYGGSKTLLEKGKRTALDSIWWKIARSSVFYDGLLGKDFYGLTEKNAADIVGYVIAKFLIYWKYKALSVIGFNKSHYKRKL